MLAGSEILGIRHRHAHRTLRLRILMAPIVLIAGPACAQNLPWCAVPSDGGSIDCSYYTQQECFATTSGVGGYCNPNPSASTPTLVPAAPLLGAGRGAPLELAPGPPLGPNGLYDPGPPPE
jgi:hypothetical protein